MERSRSPLPHAKEVLAGYYREHGIMPSVQRLADLLDLASTSSAHYVVQKLRDEGYLAANEHGKLTPAPCSIRPLGAMTFLLNCCRCFPPATGCGCSSR